MQLFGFKTVALLAVYIFAIVGFGFTQPANAFHKSLEQPLTGKDEFSITVEEGFTLEVEESDSCSSDSECGAEEFMGGSFLVDPTAHFPKRGTQPTNKAFEVCQESLQRAIRQARLEGVTGTCVGIPASENAVGLTHWFNQESPIHLEVDPSTGWGIAQTIKHEVCHAKLIREYGDPDHDHNDRHIDCMNN